MNRKIEITVVKVMKIRQILCVIELIFCFERMNTEEIKGYGNSNEYVLKNVKNVTYTS